VQKTENGFGFDSQITESSNNLTPAEMVFRQKLQAVCNSKKSDKK